MQGRLPPTHPFLRTHEDGLQQELVLLVSALLLFHTHSHLGAAHYNLCSRGCAVGALLRDTLAVAIKGDAFIRSSFEDFDQICFSHELPTAPN